MIQYREKLKCKRERVKECTEILKLTRAQGGYFIVNDDIDIALAIGADGIHLGQDDLPLHMAKKLAPHLLIGISTHCKEQALEAEAMGADYIGVGPVFDTSTKENVEKSNGLSYVQWVSENIKIPFVTIGGIQRSNVESVLDHGGTCFAMISELVGSEDIDQTVSEIRQLLKIEEL